MNIFSFAHVADIFVLQRDFTLKWERAYITHSLTHTLEFVMANSTVCVCVCGFPFPSLICSLYSRSLPLMRITEISRHIGLFSPR